MQVVIFDGECLFCLRSVRFIHRHDRAGAFRFASRQSSTGTRLLREAGVGSMPNSLVLIDQDGVWLRSDAVLRVAARLGPPWSLARAGLLVPRGLRDAAYRVVAAIRHRLSARLGPCPLPDEALRAKMLH